MIIAIDSGVRIGSCYSYISRRIETVGIVVTGIISDTGIVDLLPIESTVPGTHDIEVEMAHLYAGRAEACVFDGMPARACRRNVGVIKKMAEVKGWRCQQYGPYIICADFELDMDLIKRAVEMNAAVHRIVHRRAKVLFEYKLAQRKCIMAEGIHMIPELSYFSQS